MNRENMKTTVIYHSADYDGLFCREIARNFLPAAELIGWDFGDKPLAIPQGRVYVLDLPIDRVFGYNFALEGIKVALPVIDFSNFVWIDHHASSLATHPKDILGYRIDGVSACRLAWQWFKYQTECEDETQFTLPTLSDFKGRFVAEPLAITLAGEYDVWQHENSKEDDIAFQFGLDAQLTIDWAGLLQMGEDAEDYVDGILIDGRPIKHCIEKRDAETASRSAHLIKWDGLIFLALNRGFIYNVTQAGRSANELVG